MELISFVVLYIKLNNMNKPILKHHLTAKRGCFNQINNYANLK